MINYYLITKPGIVIGNLVTVAAGFLLGSKGHINFGLFLATLIGLAFIMASACVFNNYIDRSIDKKMKRTKNRPLVTGLIAGKNAIVFATILAIIGNTVLFLYANLLTVLVASIGFFVYVVMYSLWKRHTIHGTAIGSVAGATPPLVGYCAVSNQFDETAFILFMILVLWQMPHFFSIAIYRLEDYTAASIPLLPVKKGVYITKLHMVLYIIAFIFTSLLLSIKGYTGHLFGVVAAISGLIWLAMCLYGMRLESNRDKRWAYQMFVCSLVVILGISLSIPLDQFV